MKWLVNRRIAVLLLIMLLAIGSIVTPEPVLGQSAESNAAAPESKNVVQDKTQEIIDLILKDLPAPRNAEGEVQKLKVEMRDGVKLEVQVFLPEGTGPWPAILIRNPYASFKFFNEGILRSFSQYGYAGVLVDSRGTGGSGGKWEPYVNERNDGIDTLNWLIKQKWVNGKIGMYGHSYLSFSEWIIADVLPPQVKTMYISAFGTNRYEQMYQDGMFKHDISTYWAVANSGIATGEKPADLYKKALQVKPPMGIDTSLFGTELQWYRDWLKNVSPDTDFWKQGMWADLKEIPRKVSIPVFMKVGWYDHNLNGMVEAYQNLPEETKRKSRFLIGPWVHSQGTNGDIEYPNSNIAGLDGTKIALEWFDHHLQDRPYEKAKAVETYIIGEGKWKVWEDVPIKATESTRLYLNKAEGLDYKGGALNEKVASKASAQMYKYDPNNPVPTYGGEVLLSGTIQNGNKLQSAPGDRDDVLTFVSEPLEEDMRVSGRINVKLFVGSSAEDTAFTAKVMEVFPDGKAYNIRDSITSLAYRNGSTTPVQYKRGDIVDVDLEMWPVTWTFKKGSRVRVDISSSNFPAYSVHPNVPGPWAEQKEYKTANQYVFMGGIYNSYIELPIDK